MSTVVITIGVPASGKSTYATKESERTGAVIVCRDDIRIAHRIKSGADEDFVTRVHRAQIEGAILSGLDVIVADTNLNKTFRNRLIKFAHEYGADVILRYFPVDLDTAILRDQMRESTVGPDVVKRFHDMYVSQGLPTEPTEKFLPVAGYAPYHHTLGNPPAIVVDIDGTLAHTKGRSPYDESRVSEDAFDENVAAAVVGMSNYTGAEIIVVSGRTDKCREKTEAWMEENEFPWDWFYMRKHGDQRPDYIVKNEIYDEHIIPYFNILAVFDDRDQ